MNVKIRAAVLATLGLTMGLTALSAFAADSEKKPETLASASPARPVARTSNAPRIAYSAVWASLRSTRSHVPSPVPRSGIEENEKMTAAHTRTGSQFRTNGPRTVR